jgi:hypothetical protein
MFVEFGGFPRPKRRPRNRYRQKPFWPLHDLCGAYGLTTGSGIVEALVRAKQRGVDVCGSAPKWDPFQIGLNTLISLRKRATW